MVHFKLRNVLMSLYQPEWPQKTPTPHHVTTHHVKHLKVHHPLQYDSITVIKKTKPVNTIKNTQTSMTV